MRRSLSTDNIKTAMETISPGFIHSPQFVSEPLSKQLGCRLILKIETVNPVRSFKGRGTEWFVSTLPPNVSRLVCASAGNFGQALAYSARGRDLPVTIFAAETASPFKVQRMRELGADVRLFGKDFDEAKTFAERFAHCEGGQFVEDGRERAVSEGAGTIAFELCGFPDTLDCLIAPVGNGALLAGVGAWMKSNSPSTKIVGACSTGAPSMALSWREGVPRTTEAVSTIADGIAVRVPVSEALEDLAAVVDDILLVDDQALLEAMQLVFRYHRIVTEPAGVAGLAAILTNSDRFRGATISTPLCGGNLSYQQIQRWLIADSQATD